MKLKITALNDRFYSMNSLELSEGKEIVVEVLRSGIIRDRDLKITDKMLSDFVQNFKADVYGNELQLNLGHNRTGEAGGWIRDLFVDGGKLKAKVELTTLGIEKLKNKLYKFVSAEFADRYKHHETGKVVENVFTGLALTNVPALKGQSPIALSEEVRLINLNNDMFKKFITNLNERPYVSKSDKELARTLFAELSEEEQAESKADVESVEAKPEEAAAPAPAEETPAPAAEEPKPEEPATPEALTEKMNAVQTQLDEQTKANKELTERLERKELSEEFASAFMLSETRSVGLVADSQDKVVDFMVGLSEEQRVAFKTILSEVKSVDLTEKGSTSTGNAAKSREDRVVELAEKKMEADPKLDIAKAQKLAEAEVK